MQPQPFDRRAYDRAYYHEKRRGTPMKRNPATAAKNARKRYWRNPEKFRAEARARIARRHLAPAMTAAWPFPKPIA